MRKACIVFLVLLVAVSGCFSLLHGSLLGVSDDVTVTRQTLYGDPSAADGVNILVRNHYDQNLMWETTLTLGDDAAPKTKFTFSNERISFYNEPDYNGVEFMSFHNVFIFSDARFPESSREKYAAMVEAFTSAVDGVPAGERKTFTINLSDYLEYYPLEGSIILPDLTTSFSEFERLTKQSEDIARRINDFFRIPMDGKFTVEYTIDKTTGGSSYGANINFNYYINGSGVATEDACYFTFNTVMVDGTIADTSLIPGGYGIYCLPYNETGLDFDALEMVYALDPTERYDSMYLSDDGKRIRLHTWQGSELMLTIIDIETMTQLQKVKLLTDSEEWHYDVIGYDDFTLIVENRYNSDSMDRITIWEERSDGTYSQAFTVGISVEVFPEKARLNLFNRYNNAVDYADGKLVVLHHRMFHQEPYWSDNYCDLYVAVYDATGLVYAGTCEWNLSQVNSMDPYAERIEPFFNDSLEVSW